MYSIYIYIRPRLYICVLCFLPLKGILYKELETKEALAYFCCRPPPLSLYSSGLREERLRGSRSKESSHFLEPSSEVAVGGGGWTRYDSKTVRASSTTS